MIEQHSTAIEMDNGPVGFLETAHAFTVVHRVESKLFCQFSWEHAMHGGISVANYAANNIEPNSVSRCAEHAHKAIGWGGIPLQRTRSAKDCDPSLLIAGFHEVIDLPVEGDVIMIRPAPGRPHGHMAIYDGSHWISNFKQLHDFYPGPAHRSAKPAYKTYRYH